MKLKPLILVAAFSFAVMAEAADSRRVDAPDVVRSPHVSIKLSKAQQEEVMTLGTVTLEPEQWELVRNQDSTIPKRIMFVMTRHADPEEASSCDAPDAMAIQTAVDQAAIIISPGEQWDAQKISAMLDPKTDQWGVRMVGKTGDDYALDFYMDDHGQMYLDGHLLPFAGLIHSVSLKRARKDGKFTKGNAVISVHIPVDLAPESVVLSERLRLLKHASEIGEWAGFSVVR